MSEVYENGRLDEEPNLLLRLTYADNSIFEIRADYYSIAFADGVFLQNLKNVHYHDNLIVRVPNTRDFSIVALLAQFHLAKEIVKVEMIDQDTETLLYEENTYWDTVYGVRSVEAMDNTIAEYELILCHKVASED